MAKLTRKSYKRKKIAFAAVILGGVALVSSGFAAWVLSNNKADDKTGGVHVGEVKDASLSMDIQLKTKRYTNDSQEWSLQEDVNSGKFNFNPEFGDYEGVGGRVYNDKESNDKFDCENLTLRYTVTVTSTSKSAFKQLEVTMTETGTDTTKITTATTQNHWVAAPQCFGKTVTIGSDRFRDSENQEENNTKTYTWVFDFDLTFSWGSDFEGMNPAKYFDENETGKTIPLKRITSGSPQTPDNVKTVQEILNEMHNTLDNATFNLNFVAVAQ